MSLINQMLQALEQRQDHPPEPSPAVRVAAPPARGDRTRWLWLGGASLLLLAFAAGWLLRREAPQSGEPKTLDLPAEVKTVAPVPLPPAAAKTVVESLPKQVQMSGSAVETATAPAIGSVPQRGRAESEGIAGKGELNEAAETAFTHPHPRVQAGQSLSGPLRAAAPCNPAVLPDCPPQGEGDRTPSSSHSSPRDNNVEITAASEITSLPPRGRTGGGESNKAAATDPAESGKIAPQRSASIPATAEKTAQLKQTTPRQRAEQSYQQAISFQRERRDAEAMDAFRRTLQLAPEHAAARQALAMQLTENGEAEAAEALLKEGMQLNPGQPGLSMSLARLMVERGDDAGALELLDKQGHAGRFGADHQALYAALLQRAGRHADAVERYRLALGANPASAQNWAGLGISLRATGQTQTARESFQRALQVGGLDPALESYVRENLRELRGESGE